MAVEHTYLAQLLQSLECDEDDIKTGTLALEGATMEHREHE
jgi:hypothetical protein